MKLLWDGVGTEFGGRHEEMRRCALFVAIPPGDANRWKGFADTCMADYDTKGWTVPDLINPDDVSMLR